MRMRMFKSATDVWPAKQWLLMQNAYPTDCVTCRGDVHDAVLLSVIEILQDLAYKNSRNFG